MSDANSARISEIRSFNRFYTNILGLLNKHILDSDYSLTEVRIMLEIDRAAGCTANSLIDRLEVDRGYMSRILKRFESNGLITKESSASDARKTLLQLTVQGKQLLSELEAKSDRQVRGLIRNLPEEQQKKLVASMKYIKDSLSAAINPVSIRDFESKDIGYIIDRHRELYEREYGFSPVFGDYVAEAVSKFAAAYDKERENIWIAEAEGETAGVIALVRVDDETAQLRWFLMEPRMRSKGIGHALMKTLMDFCRAKNYSHVFLWTVSLLGAARHLYESYGFRLTETHENNSWSREPITEERWDAYLSGE